ncbi:MAG: hypothetical protein HC802_11990 [Caldilineaceae bacterium]|nr:hypothetical protein [Caldilineaceae bacterium]
MPFTRLLLAFSLLLLLLFAGLTWVIRVAPLAADDATSLEMQGDVDAAYEPVTAVEERTPVFDSANPLPPAATQFQPAEPTHAVEPIAPEPTPGPASLLLPTPSPTPAQDVTPVAQAVQLTGFRHMWQTWNNCGPATLAMNLSYFGSGLDQAVVGATLRPNPEDKNVNPQELAAFARQQGYAAAVRVDGDAATLRALLDNGFPVLIETWLEPEPNDGLGHYRLLVGYDDLAEQWIAYDSYVGVNFVNPNGDYQGIHLPYAELDPLWKVFNRTFVLILPLERRALVESILGDPLEDSAMWTKALATADRELVSDAADRFAWFNRGSALTALGDNVGAVEAFDRARGLGLPWRMLWYQFGPFEAYNAVGRHQDVIQLTDTILAPDVQIEELYFWRSRAFEALGDGAAATTAWDQAVYLNPNYANGVTVVAPGTPIGRWE